MQLKIEPSTLVNTDVLQHWNRNRYVLFRGLLDPAQQGLMREWTEDLQDRPESPGQWMKYFEGGDGERKLCRVENFIPFHEGFRELLVDGKLIDVLSALMGDRAVLFKEKINFKLPGGQGFAPHQDAPAFTTFKQNYHVTVMVAVDPSTVQNGCLEVVEGFADEDILPQAEDGTIRQEFVNAMEWKPVEMEPGDVLIFDSYIPHRSAPNLSSAPRRALYITYNRESDGYVREAYFEHKRKTFPPEVERVPGVPLPEEARRYNLGNPIR